MENVKEIIARNLAELRKSHKMTQSAIAEKLNYSDKAISRWEHAETLPDIETLCRICEIYGVSFEYLLNKDPSEINYAILEKNGMLSVIPKAPFRPATPVDLGKDVSPEKIVRVATEKSCDIVGLSALMTTTLPAMEETVSLVRRELPACRIMVGGAVLTEEYAKKIGADFYGKDAMEAVKYLENVK